MCLEAGLVGFSTFWFYTSFFLQSYCTIYNQEYDHNVVLYTFRKVTIKDRIIKHVKAKNTVDTGLNPYHGKLENSKYLVQSPYGPPFCSPTDGLK